MFNKYSKLLLCSMFLVGSISAAASSSATTKKDFSNGALSQLIKSSTFLMAPILPKVTTQLVESSFSEDIFAAQHDLMKKELINLFYNLPPETKESLGQEFIDEVSRQTHSIFTLFPELPAELQQEILIRAAENDPKTCCSIALTSRQAQEKIYNIWKYQKFMGTNRSVISAFDDAKKHNMPISVLRMFVKWAEGEDPRTILLLNEHKRLKDELTELEIKFIKHQDEVNELVRKYRL